MIKIALSELADVTTAGARQVKGGGPHVRVFDGVTSAEFR